MSDPGNLILLGIALLSLCMLGIVILGAIRIVFTDLKYSP